MLNTRPRYKFECTTIEGILVGYGANSHSYRVLKKSSVCIEKSSDVRFGESSGSQVEQVDPTVVGGVDLSQAIKKMAIVDIAPTNNYVPNPREKSSPGQDVPSTST